jgi:hypothetical protein
MCLTHRVVHGKPIAPSAAQGMPAATNDIAIVHRRAERNHVDKLDALGAELVHKRACQHDSIPFLSLSIMEFRATAIDTGATQAQTTRGSCAITVVMAYH